MTNKKILNLLTISTLSAVTLSGVASAKEVVTEDLVLEGARWLASATGFVCEAGDEPSAVVPDSLAAIQIEFEDFVTDYTLDNGLLTASYVEGDLSCRYSALLLADNTASTIVLVDSHSYSLDGSSTCPEGRSLLDNYLQENDYLYWGHPHHLSILIPETSAANYCGEGVNHIGIDFQLVGRIQE